MSDKMRNLLVRTLSGAVLTVVVVGAVLWSQWSFGVLLLAILGRRYVGVYRMAAGRIFTLSNGSDWLRVRLFSWRVSCWRFLRSRWRCCRERFPFLLWLLPVFILLIPSDIRL